MAIRMPCMMIRHKMQHTRPAGRIHSNRTLTNWLHCMQKYGNHSRNWDNSLIPAQEKHSQFIAWSRAHLQPDTSFRHVTYMAESPTCDKEVYKFQVIICRGTGALRLRTRLVSPDNHGAIKFSSLLEFESRHMPH